MYELTKSFWQRSYTPSHFDSGRISTVARPRDERGGKPVMDYDNIYSIPYTPISYITLFQAMYLSLPWSFAIQTKIQEKYRKGLEVVPLFSSRCKTCERKGRGRGTFQKITPDQLCPNCGGKLKGPDAEDKMIGQGWIEECNMNRETLKMVMKEAHWGIAVIDDGYIIVRKEYYIDERTGDISHYKVQEIIGASPIIIRPIMENRTATPGGKYWVCPVHRQQIKERPAIGNMEDLQQYAETEVDAPMCPEKGCRARMRDVKYVSIFHERGRIENYYIEGEVIHWKEYRQNKAFSIPPGVTLWVPSSIITFKDAYIRDLFYKQRKPRSMVAIMTNNPSGFFRLWDKAMERVKNDWGYSPIIPFESEPGMPGTGAGRVQHIDLMGSMKDMDYNEIRGTYERSLYQWYGIGNVFANIDSGAGGKGEPEKLLISNRHVENSNQIDNEIPLRLLSLMVGMREYAFRVVNPEDRDEAKKENLVSLRDTNAMNKQQLGYEATLDPITGTWLFKKDTQKELNKAVNMINTLLSFEGGQPQAGGAESSDGQGMETNIPKVDGNEFSGQASGEIEKATGDTSIHHGDMKPTPASSKVSSGGGQAGGYTASDGTYWDTKEAKGGHERSLEQNGGAATGVGGGGMDENGMAMGYTKEQYQKVLDILEKADVIPKSIMKMIKAIVEGMDAKALTAPQDQGVQSNQNSN